MATLLLMGEDEQQSEPNPTQQTQPKGIDPKTGKPYAPVEIPVPKKRGVMGFLEKVAKTPDPDRER